MLTLESGRTRATVAPEYGGRVAQFEIHRDDAWIPLLYTPDVPLDERDPTGWGCFPMAPWPNRIAEARFWFEGAAYALAVNAPPHALHGLGSAAMWRVESQSAASCVMSLEFGDAWPFGGRAVHRISVRDDGLNLTLVLYADVRAYPAGAGWHPWFRRDVGASGDVAITVDADEFYELEAMIPTGRLLPVDSGRDLRGGPAIEDRRIDDCYYRPRGDLRVEWHGAVLSVAMRTRRTSRMRSSTRQSRRCASNHRPVPSTRST